MKKDCEKRSEILLDARNIDETINIDKKTVNDALAGKVALDFGAIKRQIIMQMNDIGTYQAYTIAGYKKEDIIKAMDDPFTSWRVFADLSKYTYAKSGIYKRLILHMANMLTLDYLVQTEVSSSVDQGKIDQGKFLKKYDKVMYFVDYKLSVKHEVGKILLPVVREGIYYGYAMEDQHDFFFHRLPSRACRAVQLQDGSYNVYFDLHYINNGNINSIPGDIVNMWRDNLEKGISEIRLPPTKAICIKMDETYPCPLPLFIDILKDIYNLEDYKELEKAKAEMDNYEILLLKIPIDKDKTDGLLLSRPVVLDATEIANEVVPENIAVLPVPMDAELIHTDKDTRERTNIRNAVNQIYYESGVSQEIGNSNNSVALQASLENDAAIMYRILRQVERWFNRRFKLMRLNNGDYHFKLQFFDCTVYNRDKVFDRHFKAAQSSYPNKMAVASLLGYNQSALRGADFVENQVLKLGQNWMPLRTSYTQSGERDGGAPEKAVDELTEKGLETKETGGNIREV